jgi:hypothetical protein
MFSYKRIEYEIIYILTLMMLPKICEHNKIVYKISYFGVNEYKYETKHLF